MRFAPKHGMHGHPGYKSWQGLRQRCENPNDTAYKDYGGRGIAVCPQWASFEAFWADMGAAWFKGGTIERRDVNGDYEPSNCCWIPKRDQPKNRRGVHYIDTPWGVLGMPAAAAHLGLSHPAFCRRYRQGWRGDRLFSAPVEKGARITPRTRGNNAARSP